MKSKSEVNLLFQKFHKMVCSQYNAQVQVLRSDNGGEYLSFELKRYLEAHRIIHQTTCSDTPQQNGGGGAEKSSLVGGCPCFIDRSAYAFILLGTYTYLCNIFDQPSTFQHY